MADYKILNYTTTAQFQNAMDAVRLKLHNISGAPTGFTESRAIQSGTGGLLEVSSVTAAELAFLSGVTSDIQIQLNAKAGTGTANTFTATNIFSNAVPMQLSGLTASTFLTLDDSKQVTGTVATSSIPTLAGDQTFTGDNAFTGKLAYRVKSVDGATDPYVVDTSTDDTIISIKNTSASTLGITIPTAVGCTGRLLIIKDAGGNANTFNITLTPAGGNIDGAATLVLSTNYIAVTLYSDGTDWYII